MAVNHNLSISQAESPRAAVASLPPFSSIHTRISAADPSPMSPLSRSTYIGHITGALRNCYDNENAAKQYDGSYSCVIFFGTFLCRSLQNNYDQIQSSLENVNTAVCVVT